MLWLGKRQNVPATFGATNSIRCEPALALPILVRQALSRKPINYSKLASELEMPNPRNLDYVLGSVGSALNNISQRRKWGSRKHPHIQSLVINKNTRLPGLVSTISWPVEMLTTEG